MMNILEMKTQPTTERIRESKIRLPERIPYYRRRTRIIQEWKDTHFKEKHRDRNLNWAEAIGGRFTYTFIPTSIGVIGEVTCSCGESMTFSNLM